MKREKLENLSERDFVTSLIISDKCCQVLLQYVKPNYFDSEYARIVTEWVSEYYHKFKCCPKDDITSLYRAHHDEIQDESLRELIAVFLQNLADSDLNINNEDYLLDRSKDFLDKKALKVYTEEIAACLETNNMEKARKIQSNYKKVSAKETNEVSLFSKSDIKIIQESLNKVDEELMTLPENLNKVTGKLHRNDFMAILAPPKKGKSWFMQYLAVEAVRQGLNTVLVSMEMTREEVVQRLWKMMFGSKSGIIPEGTYEGARFIEDDLNPGKWKSELIDVKVKSKSSKSVATLQKQMIMQNQHKGDLRVIAYPTFGASVEEICQRVEDLASENFVADVVIIDYADITKPIGGGTELRNQLDEIWKYLRGFSTKFHCLMITASQTNRTAWNSSKVGGESVGENFKKLAHITSFISMEQTSKMKKEHLMRLRNIAVRNDNVADTCVFPQCLDLGQFIFGNPILGEDFTMPDDDFEDESDNN